MAVPTFQPTLHDLHNIEEYTENILQNVEDKKYGLVILEAPKEFIDQMNKKIKIPRNLKIWYQYYLK